MKKLTVGLGTGLAAGLLAAAAVMNVGAAANGQTAAITEERAKETPWTTRAWTGKTFPTSR